MEQNLDDIISDKKRMSELRLFLPFLTCSMLLNYNALKCAPGVGELVNTILLPNQRGGGKGKDRAERERETGTPLGALWGCPDPFLGTSGSPLSPVWGRLSLRIPHRNWGDTMAYSMPVSKVLSMNTQTL